MDVAIFQESNREMNKLNMARRYFPGMMTVIFVFILLVLLSALEITAAESRPQEVLKIREYRGNIKSLGIGMSLLIWDDGIITGGYWYQKYKILIPLIGRYGGDRTVELRESKKMPGDPDKETVTGYFRGSFGSNFATLTGRWESPDGSKTFPFNAALNAKQTAAASKNPVRDIILGIPVRSSDKRAILSEIADAPPDEESGEEGSSTSVAYSSQTLLSLLTRDDYRGATHPNHSYRARNYWLKEGRAIPLNLADLFKPASGYEDALSTIVMTELRRQSASSVTDGQITRLEEQLEAFSITATALEFNFAPYEVGSYVEGDHIVNIPYRKLAHLIRPDGPLAGMIRTGTIPEISDKDKNARLSEAVVTMDVPLAKALLKRGANPNQKLAEGKTLLHQAVHEQDQEMVNLLIDQGANLNADDNADGLTPLQQAVQYGDIPMVTLLLAKGADINGANRSGGLPLTVAIDQDQREMAAFLLTRGASLTVRNKEGNQPLHLACKNNSTPLAELFLVHGAEVNGRGSNGMTPLMFAREPVLAKLLLARGARIDLTDDRGATVLNEYVGFPLLALYVAHGADVTHTTRFGNSPLSVASYYGDLDGVKLLVSRGAKVTERDSYSGTLLMDAAKTDSVAVAAYLIEHGVELDVQDNGEYTAVMYAVSGNRQKVLEVLINSGANINLRTPRSKETALTIAKKTGLRDIITTLKKHGAVE